MLIYTNCINIIIKKKIQKNLKNLTFFRSVATKKQANLNGVNAFNFKQPFSFTINSVLNGKNTHKFNNFSWKYGKNLDEKYFDENAASDFITNKKSIKRLYKRISYSEKKDLIPNKYFFYHHRRDPVYNSWLLEKVICVFFKHGKKEKMRKIFYNIFLTDKYNYSLDTLYAIIGMLRPKFLNVKIKRDEQMTGDDEYKKDSDNKKKDKRERNYEFDSRAYQGRGGVITRYKSISQEEFDEKFAKPQTAPIPASDLKSTIKAIHFFKKAVLDNRYEISFEDKILNELDLMLDEDSGYYNPYYEEYVAESERTEHLSHYRKRSIY